MPKGHGLGKHKAQWSSQTAIAPKPVPLGGSWWLDLPRDGFTDRATALWSQRYPTMAGVMMAAAKKHGTL